jgi:hypothetical protein
MQHKWHKEIKAWADGAEIEARNREGYNNPNAEFANWWTIKDPHWETHNDIEYRIKAQPKEPQYLYVYKHEGNGISFGYKPHAGTNMWQTKVIGKIKLENDDAM